MDVFVFKGRSNYNMLKELERFRIDVWSRIILPNIAGQRFGLDSFDMFAWHVVVADKGRILGSARLIIADSFLDIPDMCSFNPYIKQMHYPVAFMNRLVVGEQYRSNGVGKRLNRKRDELVVLSHAHEVWIEAEKNRHVSLLQNNYRHIGPSADESVDGDWSIYCKKMN